MEITRYDVNTDSRIPVTQEWVDQVQEFMARVSVANCEEIAPLRHHKDPDRGRKLASIRLAMFCSRHLPTDGVFIAEDMPIEPYDGVTHLDGSPVYPPVPKTPFHVGSLMAADFGAEIVQRWNGYLDRRNAAAVLRKIAPADDRKDKSVIHSVVAAIKAAHQRAAKDHLSEGPSTVQDRMEWCREAELTAPVMAVFLSTEDHSAHFEDGCLVRLVNHETGKSIRLSADFILDLADSIVYRVTNDGELSGSERFHYGRSASADDMGISPETFTGGPLVVGESEE